jgi:maltooligosyltrehalose trehalohydrolase
VLQRQFGPLLTETGAKFRLWAPAATRVDLVVESPIAMMPEKDGWYVTEIPGARAGLRYKFRIDDQVDVPDPASGFQPDDVFGLGEVVDHTAYAWKAPAWRGRPWHEVVILEVHVGTFTPEGTFRAAIDRLDHLSATGITALELMPVADFPGSRNWGYDGVLWFAPDSSYGTPEDLKALVDAAHERGIMVFLDVVYNHFGPEGNYLGLYAPQFFTEADTPWGSAIAYRRPEVRAFAVENAFCWLHDYRFDGLRLDAVHAIVEPGRRDLLRELSCAAGELASSTGRLIHLMLENDDNTTSLLDPAELVPHGAYRAQWNDDYHHAWHVLLTGETHGYYEDYKSSPAQNIARALGSGFVYQGEPSAHRSGRPRGEPSGALSPLAFINFVQNHDQIGNRALGDRLAANAAEEAIEASLAITLIAPTVPMLFMGEEWGSARPFPFFCDFQGDLADAVRAGRRREFADAYARYGDEIPDPLSEAAFREAVLDWEVRASGSGMRRLELVRRLLAVRRREVVPRVTGAKFDSAECSAKRLSACWRMGDGTSLRLLANLSSQTIQPVSSGGTLIWGCELTDGLPPWTVNWRIET